ncbi:MAG: GIY-YIG nuclease family protein [Bacteroidales bacterium]|nr:GIY-YIG nuclease family protein [Bacteroidales bacterium]
MKTRKELRDEYRLIKFKIGVFQIRNMLNGRIFIGSSLDLVAIWHAQKLQLDAGMHSNEELQKDWKLYGRENFSYEILEEIKQTDQMTSDFMKEVKTLEELMIEELQPFDSKGYNRKRNR